jgi:hypothetical protein
MECMRAMSMFDGKARGRNMKSVVISDSQPWWPIQLKGMDGNFFSPSDHVIGQAPAAERGCCTAHKEQDSQERGVHLFASMTMNEVVHLRPRPHAPEMSARDSTRPSRASFFCLQMYPVGTQEKKDLKKVSFS